MLDWMKKLFNKEEEQTAINKEVPKQIESQSKIPRVNHYTEAREAQMASRNAGKCRFPLVPDNGFDEEDVIATGHFEEQPVQVVTYENQPTQRGIKVERSRRQYVEQVVSTYEEPEVQYEPEREPVVKKASAPSQESNRRPFRPTEMISPIYGYNRPSVEKKVEKQEEEKEREDLEISVEGKSVVDAWLEKKGYTLSDFSEGQATTSSSHEGVDQRDQQSKKEEKSVVDQWLEKNGYEIERQEPIVEKEVVQEISAQQAVPAGEVPHQTIAERMEDAKQESDVVAKNILQTELVDSKVEHEDTILSEETKRNTEIEQPTIEVEKQAPEESVIVKAEEKLEETIVVEIQEEVEAIAEAEAPEEVEVIAETKESEEVEVITETEAQEEAEVIAETEESEEVEVIAETEVPEEVEVIAETKESEEVEVITETEAQEEAEVITETEAQEEAEVIAETEESEEVEVIAEAEELEKVEVIAETEAPEEAEVIAETEESEEEVEVITETEEPEEVEVIAEAEESEKVEVIAEAEELEKVEVITETEAPEEAEPVALEETQQEMVLNEAIEQTNEFIHVAEAEEQAKKDVQSFADVLIAEEQQVVEEAPIAEEQQVVEEAPIAEEQQVVEEAPIAEERQVVEETPVSEEQPIVQKEEPKRQKKRHVPFNVVMLKQDRTRLMERHAARVNAMQSSMSERVENKPVQQVEERPVPQVEEKPMQQEVVEPQVEEKPMQQVVVESRVEEKPMQQVVVESRVEEKPMQQVVVESRVEEQPVQQEVVEPQVEEKSMQQVVVEQVQKPTSSTEVQEKAYVVNQRENDMRNVLQTPPTYAIPPLTLLSIPQQAALDNTEWLDEQKELLDTTFNNFHVGAHVINVSQGPAVTRFEVQPDPGVKVNKITNLSDDIKLSLAAKDIRIEAPIPGKSAIGIEVPNKESKPVFLREILRSPVFTKSESPLTVALGLDISGDPIVTDIRKMPHGLIAGATGSGKSVCINAILTSILYKAKPHEVKLMLIDPKMVELAPYNSVPHLVAPVITDVKAATAALKWAVEEMERRYELFAHAGARDLTRYNTIVSGREIPGETLPYIVIVIDELADLMMVAPGDVEEAICRIAQKARACGIHLLVATQRPSVDVITGLIKSNIPTRIAFTVSSQVDSRTIIDIGGAEKLLGRGDMLFLGNGTSKPVRVQGVYVSDDEIEKTVDHVRKQMKPNYLFKQEDLLAKTEQAESEDELFFDACQFVVEQGGASTSSVQRKFRIGYNRAARLIEEMESQGIISEGRGTKPRDVLISEDEFAAMQETNV
ncbi:DNA translocase FtsK [Bacillus wiedmannii]|uniref:DNA translocase FtsK n=1 Tax=Bacillus wiedmannii TaxID=1890302 RepID=UPI00365E7CE1